MCQCLAFANKISFRNASEISQLKFENKLKKMFMIFVIKKT